MNKIALTTLPENKKIYFASDFHLGMYPPDDSRKREKIIISWLDDISKDAHEIFLCGDIFDFWYEYKKVIPRGFARFLGKVAQLTDQGIPVTIFTGNHDIWMFNYLQQELGVKVQRDPLIRVFNDKTFYIAHGDGLGPGENGFKLMKKMFNSRFLQWMFSRLHPNFAFWIGHTWSKKSRYAKGIEASPFQGPDKELMLLHSQEVTKNTPVDYFIYGHRHLATKYEMPNGALYFTLGDWITLFSYAVFDGKNMDLKYYKTN